jgi:hypothetical protein
MPRKHVKLSAKEKKSAKIRAMEKLRAAIRAQQVNSCKYCGAPTRGVACNAYACQKQRQRDFDKVRRETGVIQPHALTYRQREEAAVRQLRIDLGLPQLESGNRPCRMCENVFYSWDKLRNQHCPDCQARLDHMGADGLHGFHRGVSGGASRRVPR